MATQVRTRKLKSRKEILRQLEIQRQLDELVLEGALIDNLDGTYSIHENSIPAPLKN